MTKNNSNVQNKTLVYNESETAYYRLTRSLVVDVRLIHTIGTSIHERHLKVKSCPHYNLQFKKDPLAMVFAVRRRLHKAHFAELHRSTTSPLP